MQRNSVPIYSIKASARKRSKRLNELGPSTSKLTKLSMAWYGRRGWPCSTWNMRGYGDGDGTGIRSWRDTLNEAHTPGPEPSFCVNSDNKRRLYGLPHHFHLHSGLAPGFFLPLSINDNAILKAGSKELNRETYPASDSILLYSTNFDMK